MRTALVLAVSPWFQRTVESRLRALPWPTRSPAARKPASACSYAWRASASRPLLEGDPAEPRQQLVPFRVAGWEQLEGLGVEPPGPGQVEGEGAVAGQDQGPPGRSGQLGQLGLAAAGRPGEGQGLGVEW